MGAGLCVVGDATDPEVVTDLAAPTRSVLSSEVPVYLWELPAVALSPGLPAIVVAPLGIVLPMVWLRSVALPPMLSPEPVLLVTVVLLAEVLLESFVWLKMVPQRPVTLLTMVRLGSVLLLAAALLKSAALLTMVRLRFVERPMLMPQELLLQESARLVTLHAKGLPGFVVSLARVLLEPVRLRPMRLQGPVLLLVVMVLLGLVRLLKVVLLGCIVLFLVDVLLRPILLPIVVVLYFDVLVVIVLLEAGRQRWVCGIRLAPLMMAPASLLVGMLLWQRRRLALGGC